MNCTEEVPAYKKLRWDICYKGKSLGVRSSDSRCPNGVAPERLSAYAKLLSSGL